MDFIEPCFGIGHNLSLICQMTSEDIKHQLIIIIITKQMFQLPSYFPQFVNTVFLYIQQALIFLPTTKMPRECVAVGCTELQTKGSLFSFHTFPTDSCRRKLHPWRFELQIVPSQLPCGHPHRHELFTKGITHHPAFARLNSEIHFDTLAPSAKIKIKIGGNLHHKKPSRK